MHRRSKAWRLATTRLSGTLPFDSTGKLMASVSDDQCIKVWRCESKDGEPFFRLDATLSRYHNRSIFGMSWSSTGAIATACGMSLLVCRLCMPFVCCLCCTACVLLVLYCLGTCRNVAKHLERRQQASFSS